MYKLAHMGEGDRPKWQRHERPWFGEPITDFSELAGTDGAAPLLFLSQRGLLNPREETMDSATPMLTDRIQILLQQLKSLLARAARIYAARVSKVVISGFVDPEEDNDQVVVTQWVDLSTEPAFRYWDLLGVMVDDWRRSLPDSLKSVADRIAIEIEWNVTGNADDRAIQSTRTI